MPITVATIHGKDHAFFKENGGWSSPPLVLINSLASLDLCSQERHICLILLNHRYSLSMALMDLGELAAEFGKSIRQVQRWIKKLRERDLIKVTPRPGRPSIIDVSPLVVAVKKLLNWQEAEQPAAEAETLAAVAVERPEPEADLSWLEPQEVEEEEIPDTPAFWDWDDVKRELQSSTLISRHVFTATLATSEGQRWEDGWLYVTIDGGIRGRIQGTIDGLVQQYVQDMFVHALGVKWEDRKPKKKPGVIERIVTPLVAATVGV